jgi:hypothetical protein
MELLQIAGGVSVLESVGVGLIVVVMFVTLMHPASDNE